MKDKKILNISSEVVPYLPQTNQAISSFKIPKNINDHGGQTRIFMPRYGLINERRHQLHEVIRLSGMNLVINDIDVPLIIKVASIPKERMQVYFIDNEDYFKGRQLEKDENGKLYEDNDERAIFFAKGVIETVKKLNWAPDIIHVQGWIAMLMPLYCKHYYTDEPILANTKVVSSIFNIPFEEPLSSNLINKLAFDGLDGELTKDLKTPNFSALAKNAIANSDGLIIADTDIDKSVKKEILSSNKPILHSSSKESFEDDYNEFYTNQILNLEK